MFRILSLGAGVQSSTLAFMGLSGEIPPIDAAVFADTQWEPAPVYDYLSFLKTEFERAGVPLHVVTAGNIRTDAMQEGARSASLPAYTRNENGDGAILRRQCTNEYKLTPLRRAERQIAGLAPGARSKGVAVERLIGISLDEIERMKDSRDAYAVNSYPLVEKRMSRHDCLRWLAAKGYPRPPKSACIGCPFHSDAYWGDMKENRPDEFGEAVEFDTHIRHGLHNVKCEGYLHRSLKPLPMVDFSTAEDKGQMMLIAGVEVDRYGFVGECEGMCGL